MTDWKLSTSINTLTYPELEERRDEILKRLNVLGSEEILKYKSGTKRPRTGNDLDCVLYEPKIDTHWDFVMKEMMWLGADFMSERKRQTSLAKKQANAVKQFHKTKEVRRLRQLAEAELKRRRISAKIGREIRGWWVKVERVIAYKQKLSAERERRSAMNKQLVELVRLTERYGEKVVKSSMVSDDFFDKVPATNSAAAVDRPKRRKENGNASKSFLQEQEDLCEATNEDIYDSDKSFSVESEDDDETTLRQAEYDEMKERMASDGKSFDSIKVGEYVADTDELRMLQEESCMDIDLLLQKYQQEAECGSSKEDFSSKHTSSNYKSRKHVTFAPPIHTQSYEDAVGELEIASYLIEKPLKDDDKSFGNNTQNFVDEMDHSDGSDEFQVEENEVDDETTIAAEEKLDREMSTDEEINLLKQESELSIEELRKLYGLDNVTDNNAECDEDDESIESTKMVNSSELSNDAAINEGSISVGGSSEVQSGVTKPQVSDTNDEPKLKNKNIEGSLHHGSVSNGKHMEITRSKSKSNIDSGDDSDEEYLLDCDAVDDETTMEIEESLGREMSVEDEINLLKRESEIPIDVLKSLYSHESNSKRNPIITSEIESIASDKSHFPENVKTAESVTLEMSCSNSIDSSASLEETNETLSKTEKAQVLSNTLDTVNDTDADEAMLALQQSEERAMSTMVPRPFLLAPWVKLRKYQQIGLNWLVSIHSRRLNGILADEMGLGKTLQTISLLSYLASFKGIWGPHLVIVPTSVIINWETELKRFSPALKVLCYYGTAKRRKELRIGWTKTNCFHVVVTSYQLAVQDSFAFKRKKWYYMILDEAHNIKNFQSQRWQTLISFNSQRRLLLTGTPLQNNLTELWSLLHFLMPHVFRSRKQFSYWFSNPMNNIIEGNSERSDELVKRLHNIIRPFLLRRLKKDVETQLPGKHEHIIKSQMSRRQMFLYEEFMSRSSTRQALKQGGNFMGMMSVLMQLRKVCNHPDLFEPRAVITPFAMESINMSVPHTILECQERSTWDKVSDFLKFHLWCGYNDLPSSSESPNYDTIMVEQFSRLRVSYPDFMKRSLDDSVDSGLEPLPESSLGQGLASHLTERRTSQMETRESLLNAQWKNNERRCKGNSFCYSYRTQCAVVLDALSCNHPRDSSGYNYHTISTPEQLLTIRKSTQQRADDFDSVIQHFAFCVPKAGVNQPKLFSAGKNVNSSPSFEDMLVEPLEDFLRPFQKVKARLSSFFPDKRLVQFDAGKLQTLSSLLHELKRGGHRALIFTQMSKMLDILEAFLNLNGHTYLRLDGSTGVERRQRLMDKFNNDEKIFCFILSTRSGGLGINLTGADTVIFYDSDWNPAMDAQAQDRAHRIGQTRDVHIYRLITEHSIEENIFLKAKQKRNLDLIVMDEGKFDSSHKNENDINFRNLYSNGGIFDILGVDAHERSDSQCQELLTSDQVAKAMVSLEDAEDAAAMKVAQKEVEDELKEFDESVEYKKEEEEEYEEKNDVFLAESSSGLEATSISNGGEVVRAGVTNEEEILKDFNEWQNQVGMAPDAIEASLSSTEKYALNFRENVDPFCSIFAIMEERRRLEVEEDRDDEVDAGALDEQKAYLEKVAFDDGDLLGTRPLPADLPRLCRLYQQEKAHLRSSRTRRKLNGENWIQKVDGLYKHPFWYNEDTGEGVWEMPSILKTLEADAQARAHGWTAIPLKPLLLVMSFLIPFPERKNASYVCHHWKEVATDASFILHVLPVEAGSAFGGRKLVNHFDSILDALQVAQPGDTLELGDGHYWINDPGLNIRFPIRIIGDESDPSHVVIELSGTVKMISTSCFVEGVTFRRPKIASSLTQKEMLLIEGGQCDMVQCTWNNQGDNGIVAVVSGAKCKWDGVTITGSRQGHGIMVQNQSCLHLENCNISRNKGSGIICSSMSFLKMNGCVIKNNSRFAVQLQGNSSLVMTNSELTLNVLGFIEKDAGSTCLPITNSSIFEYHPKHCTRTESLNT